MPCRTGRDRPGSARRPDRVPERRTVSGWCVPTRRRRRHGPRRGPGCSHACWCPPRPASLAGDRPKGAKHACCFLLGSQAILRAGNDDQLTRHPPGPRRQWLGPSLRLGQRGLRQENGDRFLFGLVNAASIRFRRHGHSGPTLDSALPTSTGGVNRTTAIPIVTIPHSRCPDFLFSRVCGMPRQTRPVLDTNLAVRTCRFRNFRPQRPFRKRPYRHPGRATTGHPTRTRDGDKGIATIGKHGETIWIRVHFAIRQRFCTAVPLRVGPVILPAPIPGSLCRLPGIQTGAGFEAAKRAPSSACWFMPAPTSGSPEKRT